MPGMASSAPRHTWQTVSTHRTSEGRLRYQTCPCGRWQLTVEQAAIAVTIPVNVRPEPADPA
jgi:hypothetical protein